MDRLTALDASFLLAERPGFPFHIGGLAVFDGAPLLDPKGHVALDRIRRVVAAHLDRVPKFRQKLLPAPFGIDLPRWTDSLQFDLADHVMAEHLPLPGDEATMLQRFTELQAATMPEDKPLWEYTFLDGLDDGRVGLAIKIHHALVDGVSGAESLEVILDVEPRSELPESAPWQPSVPPPMLRDLADTVADRLAAPLRTTRSLAGTRPGRAAHEVRALAEVLQRLKPAPACSLNAPAGPHRRFLVVRQDLSEVKRAGRRHGAKVNDVVLAAVASGLRRLLAGRDELDRVSEVQVLVPVSTRGAEGRLQLGNQVSSLLPRLPVGEADPVERLRRIVGVMEVGKSGGQIEGMHELLGLIDRLPVPLVRVVSNLTVHHQPFINLVVTNVPGPQFPLYLLEAEMLELFPYVPLSGNTTVGIAIVSYNGALNLGITVDPDHCPDADVLSEGISGGFAELL